MKSIKQITKKEMNLLIQRGIIRNTSRGYVDRNGNEIGFYRTKGVAKKRYVKDKFVNMVRSFNEKVGGCNNQLT